MLALLLTTAAAAAAQTSPRRYFTAAGRPTAAPDSAAYYTRTLRRGPGGTVSTHRTADGRRLRQEQYRDLARGVRQGPSTTYDPATGRRLSRYAYAAGQLHGLAQAWYPNGRPRWQLSYAHGQRHGELRAWYPSGRLMRRETYRAGVRTGARCYARSGRDTAYFAFSRPAGFAGGDSAATRWIRQRLRYPGRALRNQVEGRVLVRFTLDAQGRVQHPQISKGLEAGCDEEVLRVVARMPAWRPAVREGQPVAVPYELAVWFSIY
jgi:protein TonB